MARECQDSGGGNRNPHISHEICVETDKKARQGSRDPSDHLVSQKNRLSEALPTVRGPMNMRGPVSIRGPLISRGNSEHQEPSDHQGPLTNRGPPNCQGPSEYRSPLMGRFKLGGPQNSDILFLISFFWVNLGSSRKIVGQSVDFLVLGRCYLRPWKPPPPPPLFGQILAMCLFRAIIS